MPTLRKLTCLFSDIIQVMALVLLMVVAIISCTRDYPSVDRNPIPPLVSTPSSSSPSACTCSGSSPTSSTATPGSSTASPTSSTNTPGSSTTAPAVDTINAEPPRFLPDGGTFYFNTAVQLVTDTLPSQAVYEYSLDSGKSWKTGQKFTLTSGGSVLARLRVGNKISRTRTSSFSLYYRRMLVIGNSIMFHGPAPDLGWTNANGMAASAPEKDFVHLLTAQLKTLNPATTTQLQAGTGFELNFGKPTYNMDEFDQTMQTFKPDLIIVRLGENVADGDVPVRNFEGQFRQLIDRLVSLSQGQPVKIVTTTSVWEKPQTDAVIRKVIAEKGLTLVDLSCMVGQPQYFAASFSNKGVAAHPGDLGMQRITDLIWDKIQ